MVKDFSLGGFNFNIRPVQPNDNLVTYRELFVRNECAINIGREIGDENLVRCGQDYVEHVRKTELSSIDELSSVFNQKDDSCFWLLINRDTMEISGSIAIQSRKGHVAELKRMLVAKKYRRLGVGSAMVRFLLEYASAKQFSRVILSTPTVNKPGIRMYEGVGFVLSGVETYHCSDHVTCSIELANFSYDINGSP